MCHGFTSFPHSCQPIHEGGETQSLVVLLRNRPKPLVQIQTKELEAFSAHLNKTDKYVKFTRKDVKENSLAFLDCAVKMEKDRNLSNKVYRKPTDTDDYLYFDSHHLLEHKLGVIKTLHHRAKEIPTTTQETKKVPGPH